MKDLEFVSGRFFDYEIPKEKRYLLRYFKTDLQAAFLRYYLIFGNYQSFKDHTGRHCNPRMLLTLRKKFDKLEKIHDEAKTSMTEEGMRTLQLLETGQFVLTNSH